MKYVVIGAGSAGKRHAKNLLELGKHVTAIGDPKLSDLKDEIASGALTIYKNPDECLERHAKDNVVVIASPTKFHAPQALKAIDCGARALLIEKPPGVNADEVEKVMNAADMMGIKAATAFNFRCHVAFYYMRSEAQAKVGGAALNLLAQDDIKEWPSYNGGKCYMLDPDGGGVLLTSASHGIDAALYILGPAAYVVGVLGHDNPQDFGEVEHTSMIVIEHADGSSSIIRNVWARPPHSLATFLSSPHASVHNLMSSDYEQERKLMYLRMMATFTKWVEEDKDYDAICTMDQALEVMKVIDAARISASSGLRIAV
jgi:predicted dehydrogenase